MVYPMREFQLIQENLQKIKDQISEAGLDLKKVQIVAVTKLQPYAKVKAAVELGIADLGINYTQEGKELIAQLQKDYPNDLLHLHFIGHIQSRKVRDLTVYSNIDSLDRIEIAEELNKRLLLIGKTLPVLLEVNIGEENQKSGISPSEVISFLERCRAFSQIPIQGLMAMPPALEPEKRRPFFRKMRAIYDKAAKDFNLTVLSMGTSDDYLIALAEGSNQIRLGTCLFGARPSR